MRYYLACLVIGLTIGIVCCAPKVKTRNGKIKGVDKRALGTNKKYFAYYGIPYAKAPVGRLRFKPPVRYTGCRWKCLNGCSKNYRERCFQAPGLITHPMSEDCLHLNIFTPWTRRFRKNAGKKVIFYIHGGGFTSGEASSHPPSNLVTDFGVIVVVAQYRIGPLGFLSSGDAALPGNYGLLDQIMALKWVKENIRLFGGDPNDVTVYGTSAGSASASLLSLSPLTKGLFTKVILDGGVALSPWAIDVTYKDTFFKMAEKAKCLPRRNKITNDPTRYNRRIVNCLRKIPAGKLIALMADEARTSEEDVMSMEGYVSFAPVVDGIVLPRDPFDLMKDTAYLKDIGALDRKYMVGVSNNEAMLFVYGSLAQNVIPYDALVNPNNPVAQKILRNNLNSVTPCPVSKEVLHFTSFQYFYPKDSRGQSDLQSSLNFMADVDFVIPLILFVNALVRANKNVEIYPFLFDHYPPLTGTFPFSGSTHGLAMIYTFDTSSPMVPLLFYADVTSKADNNFPLFNIFRGMISNMAKNGNPSLPSAKWPRYDRMNENYMSISVRPQVRQRLYAGRVSFWTDFLPNVLGFVFTRGTGRASLAL